MAHVDTLRHRLAAVEARVIRGGGSWAALPPADQEEMNELVDLWTSRASSTGDREAQHTLGFLYYYGHGVGRDAVAAVHWERLAAEQGHPGAQRCLGACLQNGWGVERDQAEALVWYRKAADHGCAESLFNLGCAHLKSWGTSADRPKAAGYFKEAAGLGFSEAQLHHAMFLLVPGCSMAATHEGIENLRAASVQGLPEATRQLGILYQDARVCAQCGRMKTPSGARLRQCSRCRGPRYCGIECQTAHWRAGHKQDCTVGRWVD